MLRQALGRAFQIFGIFFPHGFVSDLYRNPVKGRQLEKTGIERGNVGRLEDQVEPALVESRVIDARGLSEPCPCNKMAAEFFNGGGHLNASGGHLDMTIDEAVNVVREAIIAYAELLKG